MALDYEPQGYFPSWKVRLIVRLEEFGQGVLKDRVPKTISKNLKGIKADRTPLTVVPDPDVPGRFLLQADSAASAAPTATLAGESSSDSLTQVISGVIPRKFDWKQNGFRTADELTLQIRYIDMPIDPRVIRSCAVAFYLGTMTPVEYAQGVRGITRGDAFGAGVPNAAEPLNVVADAYLDGNGNRRSNLRFTGWVDKWKMSWSDDEPYLELQCRDNTQLLLNQLAPAQLVLGMKDPIDKAIATYLSNFPQFSGMTVEYRGAPGAPVPKLEGALAGTAFRPQLGPQPGKGSGDDLVVWDYLTDIAGSIGHVVRLDGNEIIVQRAATVLHGSASPRTDDPYKGRSLPSGSFPARAFIFGRNLKSLEVSRDFANNETKNIECRCYSPRRKQVLVARYPTKDARIATSTPGDARAENKWTVVRIAGIEDPLVLQQIAEDVYHGRNRNEIEVVLKTVNLASFGGGNEDPDLLDLKSGDAVEVLVDRANPGSIAETEQAMTSKAANEERLRQLGFSKDFCSAYAKAYTDAGFQRLYRVREMTTSGEVEDGVSFEIRAGNFVQARGDVPPKAPAAKPSGSTTASQGGGKAGGNQPQKTTGSSQVTPGGGQPQPPKKGKK